MWRRGTEIGREGKGSKGEKEIWSVPCYFVNELVGEMVRNDVDEIKFDPVHLFS